MRPIDADAMVQRLEERLKELEKRGCADIAVLDILIDHLRLDSEIRTLKEWINKQPTVEAELVRHGKWLITPYTDYDDTYECSACGHGWVFVEGTPKENDANYCPNCGAKMENK